MRKVWFMAWALFLTLAVVASPEAGPPSGALSADWWKPDWHYRIKVVVTSGSYDRDDEPVELTVNLATLLSRTGNSGTLDADSIRVIHQDNPPREVLSQFEPVSGETIWLSGKMAAHTSKMFYVYFDTLENGPKPPPRYFDTMENGGILVLPSGGHLSVISKIGGRERETVRIDESSGEIDFLKPPLGSPLVDGRGSFLGFKKPAGKVEGRAVSISGGPLRYSVDFHLEPGAEESAISYSDYRYTFYYVSNGQAVRARFSQRWAASRPFTPPRTGAEWPLAFGVRAGIDAGPATAFSAAADDKANSYDILTTWGPLDGDGGASPVLADNFWGVCGESGGIGIIPVSPAYHHLCVDGHRSNEGWDWSAASQSQILLVEQGTYGEDLWIYGYSQNGWGPARDFGNRAEEPLTIEAGFVLSSAADSRAELREKPGRLPQRDVRPRSGREHKIHQDDLDKEKYRVAWFGSNWTYRMSLTFDNSSQTENLVDFPVLVVLTPGSFDYSHCQNDGRDIRFVDADDTTELKYQIEAWNYNGDSSIWVKVPQIDGSSSTDFIWMYYGNPAAVDGQDAENVWDSNFQAVWHLSEGGTGTRHDSTVNHNDATPQNYDGDEAVAGAIAGADELDGLDDYVGIPGSDIGATSVTLEAWARFNALDATTFSPVVGAWPGGTVFSTRELDGDQSPTLCVSPASGGAGAHKGLIFTFDSANDAMGAKGQTTIQVGQWYYLVGVFEYTGAGLFFGNWHVYLNGNRDNASANNYRYAGSISMPFTGTPWRLGDQNQWTDGETHASLDEVRLSRTPRSADWIAAQYLSMSDNFITFGIEAFAVRIAIEDRADGSGAEIDTRTIASGQDVVGYAISRDASDNFVANEAAAWSLINRTGGVVDGDLVASADGRSATFTGHAAGTARVRAQHATLGFDLTGIITVAAASQPPVALFEFDPHTGFPPCEIHFDASSSYDPDGRIVSHHWSFGDGMGGSGEKISHTFADRGVFLITLRVMDDDGLSAAATAQISFQAAVCPPIDVVLKREINRSLFRKEAFHTISWSPNPQNNVLTIAGYRIYRKETGLANGSLQLIGTVSGDTFSFLDAYLDAEKKFLYAVTSVESSGQESPFSSLVGN